MPTSDRRTFRFTLALAFAALGGCAPTSRGPFIDPSSLTAPSESLIPPTWQELATRHNERIASLSPLFGSGVIDVTYADDAGDSHSQQGDLSIWFRAPRSTAVSIRKVGEHLLWLGCDDADAWLFDLTTKPTTLMVSRHDASRNSDVQLVLPPLALLDLLGLSPMPQQPSSTGVAGSLDGVRFHKKLDAWVVEFTGQGGRVRMYLSRGSGLPVRIESLDGQGLVRAFSTLDRDRQLELAEASPRAPMRFPHNITVFAYAAPVDPAHPVTEPGGKLVEPSGTARIGLAQVSDGIRADGTVEPFDRLFSLERLMASLRPEVVDRP